jgi:hypothetical protein
VKRENTERNARRSERFFDISLLASSIRGEFVKRHIAYADGFNLYNRPALIRRGTRSSVTRAARHGRIRSGRNGSSRRRVDDVVVGLEGETMAKIDVKGTSITVFSDKDMDFISLTDMLKAKDGDFFVSDWLRNRNTVEFLGVWEQVHNPDFNYGGFAIIKSLAGLNNYKLSVKEWIAQTNAIGLVAKTGRYGGTYAYKDIAFEFGMWISAEFKIYLIKEFQRLKEAELQQLGWDIRRNLTKINYRIHTDAIKAKLIPPELSAEQTNQIYASEADLLNMALFGKTAKQWRDENRANKGNIRDEANAAQLVCLANLETLNAHFIHQGLQQPQRLQLLNQTAIQQMRLLLEDAGVRRLE